MDYEPARNNTLTLPNASCQLRRFINKFMPFIPGIDQSIRNRALFDDISYNFIEGSNTSHIR
jgi:hypothetical protein